MAENDFNNKLSAFILVSLFGMLILTAVVTVGSDYGVDTSQIADGSLKLDKFNESISSIEGNAKSLKERFDEQSVWSAIVGIVVEGIFGIAKDMVTMILMPFNVITNILIDIFGVPVWLTSVLLGLLILGIMFGIWRLLKIGD